MVALGTSRKRSNDPRKEQSASNAGRSGLSKNAARYNHRVRLTGSIRLYGQSEYLRQSSFLTVAAVRVEKEAD